MRWFVLWLGVALLAVGLWSHYRTGKLADEWERQNQAELAKVPLREAEARANPDRAIITYRRPADPSDAAISNGEFYLLFPPLVWDAAAGVVIAGGIAIGLYLKKRNKDVGLDVKQPS